MESIQLPMCPTNAAGKVQFAKAELLQRISAAEKAD